MLFRFRCEPGRAASSHRPTTSQARAVQVHRSLKAASTAEERRVHCSRRIDQRLDLREMVKICSYLQKAPTGRSPPGQVLLAPSAFILLGGNESRSHNKIQKRRVRSKIFFGRIAPLHRSWPARLTKCGPVTIGSWGSRGAGDRAARLRVNQQPRDNTIKRRLRKRYRKGLGEKR
jgi:hypothetical protein